MGSVLVRTADDGVHLTAQEVQKLIENGSGDAALLYIALLHRKGEAAPGELTEALHWDRNRVAAAEESLRALGLISRNTRDLPEPADERPDYHQEEIARELSENEGFRTLTAEVERRLGKRLTTADVGILLGLTDYLGLPADVVYQLVCHCSDRVAERYGAGRRPTLRQIEKEGYAWARMGIDSQKAAADYLQKDARRRKLIPQYMRALRIEDRAPVAAEERYLMSWQEMGFSPEAVSLAYEKTVYRCHEMKWPYCNGILKRWHEAGFHTVEEIEAGDRPASSGAVRQGEKPSGGMREYVQQLRKSRG